MGIGRIYMQSYREDFSENQKRGIVEAALQVIVIRPNITYLSEILKLENELKKRNEK